MKVAVVASLLAANLAICGANAADKPPLELAKTDTSMRAAMWTMRSKAIRWSGTSMPSS
jgi:hypothetical protein